ncbi:MAG: HAD-IC family P-type ATPase [Sideroxydans sp.]|nr:HAD-IC family P-type ATPase [Sideroxydans sp.]
MANSPENHIAAHTLPVPDVTEQFASHPQRGLTENEAAHRLARYGPNALLEKPPRSPWRMLAAQFADFMIMVLIAAAVVSGLVGDLKDTLTIAVIVLLNAVIGFVQEFRAERAMAALKQMTASNALVVRDGAHLSIPSGEVVPGDIVLLEAGNLVPADLRLIETVQLKIDESLLTGESATVEKHIDVLNAELPLAERNNMAYKGTSASYGRGRGIAVATGMATELGKIAALLEQDGESRTPLQKRLARFGRHLGIAVLAICAIIFATGLLRGEPVVLMFLTAVSLAVAAIPEALPAVVTISLALGAHKMVRQHALIRRLPAVETLGSVTYICTDKTGTLTQNKMHVEEVFSDSRTSHAWRDMAHEEPWITLLAALALSNDAQHSHHGKLIGDPTEIALYQAALDAGFDKTALEEIAPRSMELPFDSERKRMTTLHRQDGSFIAYTKGAPESVLPLCDTMLTASGTSPLPHAEILAIAERMAAEGLRVLAVAQRHWPALPEDAEASAIEAELVFLGLVGLMDPPRREAHHAVELCRSAGIIPVMITGDHPATARAIAARIGIDGDTVMTGAELAKLGDAQFQDRVGTIRVYARVDPAQKIRIVEALQARGEFVAMTGDGVNDAPAIKRADIGIAMGKEGTDVAREASSLVLLDDNFATIVSAVREGRRIYDNIRKFIKYTMTSNSGEVLTIFLAPFLGLPIPLLPIHILWINLVTDGLPGLALTAEPEEKGVMERPPRTPTESVFAHGMWQHIIWVGFTMAAVTLFTQAWAIHIGSAHWQTMVFTVLTLSQMGHVLAIRSEHESLFRRGLWSNPMLLGAVALTFLLQLATIYIPALHDIFRTEALSLDELALCLVLSSVVFLCVEIEKMLIRRGLIYR